MIVLQLAGQVRSNMYKDHPPVTESEKDTCAPPDIPSFIYLLGYFWDIQYPTLTLLSIKKIKMHRGNFFLHDNGCLVTNNVTVTHFTVDLEAVLKAQINKGLPVRCDSVGTHAICFVFFLLFF